MTYFSVQTTHLDFRMLYLIRRNVKHHLEKELLKFDEKNT